MEGHSTKTVLFPVVPLRTGKSKLKVRLTSIAGEEVETEILVEVSKRESVTKFNPQSV